MSDIRIGPDLGPIATSVLFENERVRVWDLCLQPGESTAWHKHEFDYVFVVTAVAPVFTEYLDGSIERQDDHLGHVEMRRVDEVHRLVNDSAMLYQNVVIELKS